MFFVCANGQRKKLQIFTRYCYKKYSFTLVVYSTKRVCYKIFSLGGTLNNKQFFTFFVRFCQLTEIMHHCLPQYHYFRMKQKYQRRKSIFL